MKLTAPMVIVGITAAGSESAHVTLMYCCCDLLREMKAEYSVLWVEPGGVGVLGVSSRKIM